MTSPITAVTALCSLCLISGILWPMISPRSRVSLRHLWLFNTKDLFSGTITLQDRPPILSITGQRRNPPFPPQQVRRFIGGAITGFFARLLFRRVRYVIYKSSVICITISHASPAETRGYAFIRNSFAVLSMGILVTRTVTALMQADNEFETRIQSKTCGDADPASNNMINILMVCVSRDNQWKFYTCQLVREIAPKRHGTPMKI